MVRYVDEEGNIISVRTLRYPIGGEYYLISPTVPGYIPEQPDVGGWIYEDTTLTIRYTRQLYRLTIRYVDVDGKEVAPPYVENLHTDDRYSVTSPVVPGYQQPRPVVSGVMGSHDETITVLYVPVPVQDTGVRLINIEDYETPLGLGNVYMQVGICLE